ncbi:Asparagine synthetase [glutamine-hydrolyzing] [Aphelenchoides besseyi]|nr:Asparagine synthetase [glutamine-hydrolyzing] [Aphelenchoides besseyi]
MCGIFGVCLHSINCVNGTNGKVKSHIPLLDVYCASKLLQHLELMYHRVLIYSFGSRHESLLSTSNQWQHDFPRAFGNQRFGVLSTDSRINRNTTGRQISIPMCVVHNGEIYNCESLKTEYCSHIENRTTCDSEVIIQLYDKFQGAELCNLLDGVFAIVVIYDDDFFAARDPIGNFQQLNNEARRMQSRVAVPFTFMFEEHNDFVVYRSEMKAIQTFCANSLNVFPPGHYYTPLTGFVRYFEPLWMQPISHYTTDVFESLRESLIAATHKRLKSDAPLAMMLSGGLDSSLICAIAARELRRQNRPLRTFSIGLNEKSPDLIAARKQALSLLPHLIYHLESYDVTTLRASTPMYLLTKRISEEGIKTVLSGEGADEILGGYLYFSNAPTLEEFHQETVSRVCNLPYADVLRADKACMANSVEIRVPFLDKRFLDVALRINPKTRFPTSRDAHSKPIEKWVLRKAFDNKDDPFLPEEVLYRQKEQFSDGVGYDWIDSLKAHAEEIVSDIELSTASSCFPLNTPKTKEAYLIRRIFAQRFPTEQAAQTVKPWIPKWQDSEDPSGRYCNNHLQSHCLTTNGITK